jgi:hypothetical protein
VFVSPAWQPWARLPRAVDTGRTQMRVLLFPDSPRGLSWGAVSWVASVSVVLLLDEYASCAALDYCIPMVDLNPID